jgi:hypothetical protein
MAARLTPEQVDLFTDYFSVADEIYDGLRNRLPQDRPSPDLDRGLTLADLDARFVERARKAADVCDLPWPPCLPDAEEYALAHYKDFR